MIAWIVAVIAFLCIVTGLAGLYLVAKAPVTAFINEKIAENAKDDVEEVSSDEAVSEDAAIEEAAIKEQEETEEMLDTIFEEVEEVNPIEEEIQTEEDPYDVWLKEQATEKISGMSLEEKVAQMFFVTPECVVTDVETCTAAGEKTRLALADFPVGGIILFKKNAEDSEQLSTMTSNLQKYSREIADLPLFIGIDEEGGKITRLADNEGFDIENTDTMAAIGETGDVSKAYSAGSHIGNYLSANGINVDFAPDADVLTNPENSVIGERSFGSDAELVAGMCSAYAQGLKEQNVLACAKHFPGHGGTAEDTHDGIAYMNKTWDEISGEELLPFKKLIEDGIRFVMASHISLPEVTGDDIPASLSGIILTQKLRMDMGYKGIIITDALNMGAVAQKYTVERSAVEAVKAGNDMLMYQSGAREAYSAVLQAVADGEISEERINESAVRIISEKIRMDSPQPEEPETEPE